MRPGFSQRERHLAAIAIEAGALSHIETRWPALCRSVFRLSRKLACLCGSGFPAATIDAEKPLSQNKQNLLPANVTRASCPAKLT